MLTSNVQSSAMFGPDPQLARIIRQVESSNKISALRFEPVVFSGLSMSDSEKNLISRIAAVNTCSFNTARVIFSSSYGLYQIMGFNIYSLGYTDTIWEFWHSESDQNQCFAEFLIRNRINLTWAELKQDRAKLLAFARVYNGPGDQVAYADAMTRAAQDLYL